MDLAYFHLWSAGYILPTDPPKPPLLLAKPVPQRGKKAARAKREKVDK